MPSFAALLRATATLLAAPVLLSAPALRGAGAQDVTSPGRVSARGVCRPEQWGARGDGHTDDTAALQNAIDFCAGGGSVLLGRGSYLSGPLFLHSHETISVMRGATLLGATDPAAYKRGGGRLYALINADHAEDLTLTGQGVIDGQGQSWWASGRAAGLRPRLILLDHVQRVRLTGLTLQNSPSFHFVPSHARNVTVDHVTVLSPADSPNTDGIDPSDTRNMTITWTTIDTGDDDIAVKAGDPDASAPDAASSDIVIRHCTFRHGHGLSIGSEVKGGVQRVYASDLTFSGTDNGLRIKTARGLGGVVDDVTFQNIQMTGVKVALSFAAYYPHVPAADVAQPVDERTPDLRGVTVSHLRARNVGRVGLVSGLPERPDLNVTLNDVQMSGARGLTVQYGALNVSADSVLDARQGRALLEGPGGVIRPANGTSALHDERPLD